MAVRTTPIYLWILHAEDRDLTHIPEITRLDITEGMTTHPHPEGLFSTEIFGEIGSKERSLNYGKIDLKVRVIHPKVYKDLMSLKSIYKGILQGTVKAVFDPKVGDFFSVPDDSEVGDTGYSFFMRHLDQLKFQPSKSTERQEKINMIERWRHRLTMKNLIVLPAGMRDIEIKDGRVSKSEDNDLYIRALSLASVIVKSTDMEAPEYDVNRRSIQNVVNDIYEYYTGIFGGKRGQQADKFMSRRVMDGSRNVITAMDASGVSLDSPNVPGFDSTVLGLYQTTRTLAPKVCHWLMQGPLRKLDTYGESLVELVDPKTLERKMVDVPPDVIDSFVSSEGLMEIIHKQESIDARHRPFMVHGHYLALVYQDVDTFKVFDSIDDLPEALAAKVKDPKDVARVDPITLEELLYYAGFRHFGNHHLFSTRYPGTDDNSTYPTRYYVRTTTTAVPLRERDYDWNVTDNDDDIAPEWPLKGVHTYHDSHAPHSGRLGHSQADFDGDTKSGTGLMSENANEELKEYLGTRQGWITPDGQMRCTIAYDTSNLIFKNLTARFNHVKPLGKGREQAMNLKKANS